MDPFLSFEVYYDGFCGKDNGIYKDEDIRCIDGCYFNLEEFKSKEIYEIIDFKNRNERAFTLFHKYHQSEVIFRSKELIEVNLDKQLSLSLSNSELFAELQRKVIKHMNDKIVAIESMPTSNLRISFYDDYSEHHIFRWLGVDSASSASFLSLYSPTVCLGSDDPGIFAVNIRNEFSHIFLELLGKNKTRKEAMDIISHIAENNRIYGFKKVM